MRGRTLHFIPYHMGLQTVLQSQRRCPHGAMHFHLHGNSRRVRVGRYRLRLCGRKHGFHDAYGARIGLGWFGVPSAYGKTNFAMMMPSSQRRAHAEP